MCAVHYASVLDILVSKMFFCCSSVGHRSSKVWSGWKRSWPCTTESQGYRTTDWCTFRTDDKLIFLAALNVDINCYKLSAKRKLCMHFVDHERSLLPVSRRLCFASVCLSVSTNTRNSCEIFERVDHSIRNSWSDFGVKDLNPRCSNFNIAGSCVTSVYSTMLILTCDVVSETESG